MKAVNSSQESGQENITHQMTDNAIQSWREEAKENSDVASKIKEAKPKHLYHILILVSLWPAAYCH